MGEPIKRGYRGEMKVIKFIDRIKSYPKTVIAVFFAVFLLTQFYSIYFKYSNMPGPMQNGMSYYTSLANYFKNHGYFDKAKLHDETELYRNNEKSSLAVFHFYSFHGASPMYIAGRIAYLFRLSGSDAVKLLYYIGIALAGLAIFLIARQEGRFPLNAAIAFTVFAFYSGNVCYRGFIDPSPQFFSTVLWMLSIWVFLYSKRWYLYFPPLIFMLLFSHISGLYGILVIGAVLLILGTLETILKLKSQISHEKKRIKNLPGFFKLTYKHYSPFFNKLIALAMFSSVLYYGYKEINHQGEYFPLFLECHMLPDFSDKNMIITKGLLFLLDYTDFKFYFLGWFLPLTLGSIYICARRKNYRYLVLFFVTLFGCLFSALFQDTFGYRTFQHLEISLLFVYIFGFQECVGFLWEYYKSGAGERYLRTKVAGSVVMLSLGAVFLLYLSYLQISNDFCNRFYAKRSWDFAAIDSYLNLPENKIRPVFYMGASIFSRSLLSLDGLWDRKFYVPEMIKVVPSKKSNSFLENFIFFAENVKNYKTSSDAHAFKRYGIEILCPSNGFIVLNTGALSAGEYVISLSDSGISPEEIDQLKVYAKINEQKHCVSESEWSKVPNTVMSPWKLPAIVTPQHFMAGLCISRMKPNYWGIRKTFTYSIHFKVPEDTKEIIIGNDGPNICVVGRIEVLHDSQSIFLLDLDAGSSKSINSSASLLLDNKTSPLLWVHPKNYNRLTNTFGVFAGKYFVLDANFGDIKAFKLYLPPAKERKK